MPKITTPKGFKINYLVVGNLNTDQTVILSHGNGNCLDDWRALGYVEKLSPYFRLILMDALGYGESDKPIDPLQYTSVRRAEDLIAVLDALKIDKVHFFGNSIGGSVGFVLAHLYPKRFFSFMIGSAHPYGSKEPIGCNIYPKTFLDRFVKDGAVKFVECMEKDFVGESFPKEVKANFLRNNSAVIVAANTPKWPDYSSYLSDIVVPVMLFAGELDPVSRFLPDVASKIPDCIVNILKEKTHAQCYWDSDLIVPIIRDFILGL